MNGSERGELVDDMVGEVLRGWLSKKRLNLTI